EEKDMEGGNVSFYNGTASYSLGYPKQDITITLTANTSYNTITTTDYSLTFGPTLAVGKLFFDKKLRTNFSTSYNTSHTKAGQQNIIYNFRLGSNYTFLKK